MSPRPQQSGSPRRSRILLAAAVGGVCAAALAATAVMLLRGSTQPVRAAGTQGSSATQARLAPELVGPAVEVVAFYEGVAAALRQESGGCPRVGRALGEALDRSGRAVAELSTARRRLGPAERAAFDAEFERGFKERLNPVRGVLAQKLGPCAQDVQVAAALRRLAALAG